MNYNLGKRVIKIPDAEIENFMKSLELSKEEAIQMWLEDEGYLENETVEELTAKAKENRITATIHDAKAEKKKKTQKERVQKPDPDKELIVQKIAESVTQFAENVQIVNKTKLISFKFGEDLYEIDIKRKRKPKK